MDNSELVPMYVNYNIKVNFSQLSKNNSSSDESQAIFSGTGIVVQLTEHVIFIKKGISIQI